METKLTEETRVESDLIGAREIPASALVQFFPIQITIGSHPLIITKDIVGSSVMSSSQRYLLVASFLWAGCCAREIFHPCFHLFSEAVIRRAASAGR